MKREPITPEVLPPQHPVARTRDGRQRPWIRRFISDNSLKKSIEFLEDVRDGRIEFEDVRVSKDGEIIRFRREPSGELRVDCGKFLTARRIPTPIPEVQGQGSKKIIVIVHGNEPEV